MKSQCPSALLVVAALLLPACGAASVAAPASAVASASAPASASASASASAPASASASASAPVSASASVWRARAVDARGRRRAIEVQVFVLDQALKNASPERTAKLGERRDNLLDEAGRALSEEIDALGRIAEEPGADSAEDLADLARALEDAGRGDEANARYTSLVARFPESPFATRAHLALASQAFAQEKLDEVVRHCEAILSSPGEEGRIEALYLKSWALRGLADAGQEDARKKAEDALVSLTQLEPHSDREEELVRAAKREIEGLKRGKVPSRVML